jgi:hypothetical protein
MVQTNVMLLGDGDLMEEHLLDEAQWDFSDHADMDSDDGQPYEVCNEECQSAKECEGEEYYEEEEPAESWEESLFGPREPEFEEVQLKPTAKFKVQPPKFTKPGLVRLVPPGRVPRPPTCPPPTMMMSKEVAKKSKSPKPSKFPEHGHGYRSQAFVTKTSSSTSSSSSSTSSKSSKTIKKWVKQSR